MQGARSRLKFVLFACTPALALFIGAELFVRTAIFVHPALVSIPLPGEGKLLVPDAELFWSLRPSNRVRYLDALVATDAHGLRSPPIEPRQPREFRILSLGESTTFGSRVQIEETYTLRLADELQSLEGDAGGIRVFTAINAGVPAYSSFQSLEYLKRRGLALEPDLVLIYHELNDYMPSTLRDSSHDEIGVLMTDARLHAMQSSWLHRIAESSALVRFLRLRLASRAVESFDLPEDQEMLEASVPEIGLSSVGVRPRVHAWGDRADGHARFDEFALGQRVSESERLAHLQAFARIADEQGIELVLIHPSYQATERHECLLTRFAGEHDVALFDAHAALHPRERLEDALFLDSWHPSPLGHARLASELATFVWERIQP